MLLDCFKPLSSCILPSSKLVKNETKHKPSPSSPSVETPTEDYDPHDYGKLHYPTVFWGPVFHLLKSIFGAGILALPYTFQSVGYGVAILGTIIIGVMYAHVLHLLLDVEYRLCKKLRTPNLTYISVVQHSFDQGPPYIRGFTGIAKFLLYFHYTFNKSITNAVYLITVAGNFQLILNHYFDGNMSLVTMINIIIVPLVGLACIRNLKFLAPLSVLSNIFQIASLVIILVIPSDYDGSSDINVISDLKNLPYFLGVVFGAYNCTGIILPLKNDLEKPKKFTTCFGVLNIGFTGATLLFCAFGVLTYIKHGNHLQPNVLFNLPPNQLASFTISSLYSLALCISFILFIYIAFDTLWSNILVHMNLKYPTATEYGLRIAFCLLPHIMAVTLPDFKIMVFLGPVIGILMDQAFPIILHFVLLAQEKQKTTRVLLVLFKDFVLIIICLGLFIGTLIEVVCSIVQFYR